MKKIIITLLILVCLIAGMSSCAQLAPKSGGQKTMGLTVNKSLEDCLKHTTNIVLAKCKSSKNLTDSKEYSLKIEKMYFNIYEEYGDSDIRVIDYYGLYGGMQNGKKYILLLEKRPRVLNDYDTYLTKPVTINADNIEKSTVQNVPLAQKTAIDVTETGGFDELLKYMSECIQDSNNSYCRDYIRSSDLRVIAEKTEFLAKVKIQGVSSKTYKNDSGANLYECVVEEDFKNNLQVGETVLVWLPKKKVKEGKSYTLAFMVYANGSNYLSLSSKKNFFSEKESRTMMKCLNG